MHFNADGTILGRWVGTMQRRWLPAASMGKLRAAAKAVAVRMPGLGRILRQRDTLAEEVDTFRRREAEPHFVAGYTAFVQSLIAAHPLDEAMSLAVGGSYDQIGSIAAEVVKACGLREHDHLVDLGCGSGRLAKHIGIAYPELDYLGIDIVQELLDYAATKSPPHFRFVLHREIGIPCADCAVDFVTAFSVFTHLYHEESYAYLTDVRRVLRPGGKIVFSFLESERHWHVFEGMLLNLRVGNKQVINMFIERPQIQTWAQHLDMTIESFNPGPSIGQTVAVMRKPG